jgi:hypothetical protein
VARDEGIIADHNGVIVPHDPDFDPIVVSLLLVNSYYNDPQRRCLWGYDH